MTSDEAVRFDHRETGTPAGAWDDVVAGLPTLPLVGRRHALVLAAHPDDETLGAGGVIAALAAGGARVDVVVATDGEASHPDSSGHSAAQLAELRRAEVRAAVAALAPGVTPLLLGLPDGGLAEHEDDLAELLAGHLDGVDLLISPWTGDGHPDHEACGRVARRLAAGRIAHWQYPIWAWHWSSPGRPDLPTGELRRVPLASVAREAKAAALACHRSQHAPLSPAPGDEAILPPEIVAHFERPCEVFVVADPTPAADSRYFDRLYAADDDPWRLADSFYERRKRALLLASLPAERFGRAFEPGCATGLLTAELAARCDEVEAWDGAEQAVRLARGRVPQPHVTLQCRRIPDDWVEGEVDLLVLSEIGYYCRDLDRLVSRVAGSVAAGGTVVACHWRHPAPDHPHTGDEVHAALRRGLAGWGSVVRHEEPDFLLDVLTRGSASVAVREGVVEPYETFPDEQFPDAQFPDESERP